MTSVGLRATTGWDVTPAQGVMTPGWRCWGRITTTVDRRLAADRAKMAFKTTDTRSLDCLSPRLRTSCRSWRSRSSGWTRTTGASAVGSPRRCRPPSPSDRATRPLRPATTSEALTSRRPTVRDMAGGATTRPLRPRGRRARADRCRPDFRPGQPMEQGRRPADLVAVVASPTPTRASADDSTHPATRALTGVTGDGERLYARNSH